jgi:predicted phage terminase large subunit-like protein
MRRFATIDPAGTAEERTAEVKGRTPSWSVVQVWDQPRELSHFLLLRHQERRRVDFAALCELVRQVWREWRPTRVYIEGERLGKALLSTLKGEMALECLRIGQQGKVERAAPLIMKMQRGEIFLPKYESSWLPKFEGELLAWTGDKAEPADQIDAAAYAARVVEERRGGVVRVV